MTIVSLPDGTSYHIDTNDSFIAAKIVKKKLKDRLDLRYLEDIKITVMPDLFVDPKSPKYNSGKWGDTMSLKCATGWSYKWK